MKVIAGEVPLAGSNPTSVVIVARDIYAVALSINADDAPGLAGETAILTYALERTGWAEWRLSIYAWKNTTGSHEFVASGGTETVSYLAYCL
jgi:hypothetical protein